MQDKTSLFGGLIVAGAFLTASPQASAQEVVRRVYVPAALLTDCYYNTNNSCDAIGAYAMVSPVVVDSYASANGVPVPYVVAAPWIWRGLRGADWVAIHGAGR